jgi:hypothetical protein
LLVVTYLVKMGNGPARSWLRVDMSHLEKIRDDSSF